MPSRASQLIWMVLVGGCSWAGRGDPKPAPPQPHRPESPAAPPTAAADNSATAQTSSCPPVLLSLRVSEPPVEIRFKMRATPDGEVVDQLVVSRSVPELRQTLQVKDMDALSVIDKCAVRTVDINFDGYSDICIDVRAGSANTYAHYWVYDSPGRKLVDLGEYPELQLDAARRRLKTYERNGSGGLEYEAREYSFEGGALVLQRREVQTAVADEDGFQREVAVRRGAEMKVVENRRVRATGGE